MPVFRLKRLKSLMPCLSVCRQQTAPICLKAPPHAVKHVRTKAGRQIPTGSSGRLSLPTMKRSNTAMPISPRTPRPAAKAPVADRATRGSIGGFAHFFVNSCRQGQIRSAGIRLKPPPNALFLLIFPLTRKAFAGFFIAGTKPEWCNPGINHEGSSCLT